MQSFEFMKNWFGNRGIEVRKSHFKKWLISGDRLYWVPNNNRCPVEISTDYEGVVNVCALNSLCFEIDDEINFKDSPLVHAKQYKKLKTNVKPDSVQLIEALREEHE